MLATKVIQQNILRVDALLIQHRYNRSIHHRWPTHVILTILGRRVITQIILIKDIMYKTRQAGSVVFRQRLRQSKVPLKVVMLGSQTVKFLHIEGFPQTASAIPETNLARAFDT